MTTTYREAEFKSEFWTKHNSDRSQDRLSKNEGQGVPVCHACGAVLNPERASSVHIIGGGATVLHPDDEDAYTNADGGDMGVWDLGPECAKMFPAAYRRPFTS